MADLRDTLRDAMPGLLLSAIIALAVRFISDHLGGPAMLYALLFGMLSGFLSLVPFVGAAVGFVIALVFAIVQNVCGRSGRSSLR